MNERIVRPALETPALGARPTPEAEALIRPARLSRLPGSDFERVLKKGKRISGGGAGAAASLVLIARPSSEVEPSLSPPVGFRLGVVVGRKIIRNAAPRNRLRRILRESFRIHIPAVIVRSMDCILMARNAARGFKSRQDADRVIQKLMAKL